MTATGRDIMSTPFPLRPAVEHTPESVSTFAFGDDETAAVLETLTSEKARAILAAVAERPGTASDVATRVETSLQNAHYHLTNLSDAGLVTDAGTWYSSKGTAMTVYAVTSERLELRLEPNDASAAMEPTLAPAPESPPTDTTTMRE